jgi:hypothetical protein
MDDNRHSWNIIPDVLVAIKKEGNSSARRISYVIEGLPLYLAEVGLHNLEVLFEVGSQGKALVRAIEALGTIGPTGPTERVLAGLLLAGYKRGLQAIIQRPVRKRPARRRLIRRPVMGLQPTFQLVNHPNSGGVVV